MIIINIETYGDFDVPSTDTLMVAPDGMTESYAKQLAEQARIDYAHTSDSADLIKSLKSEGFSCVHEIKCSIGDDL